MNLRDLKAAYLTSPHFKDIYLNLTQNKFPLGKGAAKRLEQNARNYMILDGLLFKIIELDDGRLDTVLCIPTSKVHILLDTYHSSLIGGHSGISKCYQTTSQRFLGHILLGAIYVRCSKRVRISKDPTRKG